MRDELKELHELLTPADDGRGFTAAVLLRASGALARRRAGATTAEPVWGLLGRWAQPWLVAALVALAVLGIVPVLPPEEPRAEEPSAYEALVTTVVASDVAAAAVGGEERD